MPRSKVELFAATRQGSPFLGVALTAEQAAWVRAAAWRNFHRKTYADTPAFYALCACQYGSCGHCGSGQHRRCAHNDRPAHESPATYLTTARATPSPPSTRPAPARLDLRLPGRRSPPARAYAAVLTTIPHHARPRRTSPRAPPRPGHVVRSACNKPGRAAGANGDSRTDFRARQGNAAVRRSFFQAGHARRATRHRSRRPGEWQGDRREAPTPLLTMADVDVSVGTSERWGRYQEHAPVHVVDVANRLVLACTGGAATRVRRVPFDAVREELGCQPCAKFWKRLMTIPNA
jgi:Family of unknown function (DUF6248)